MPSVPERVHTAERASKTRLWIVMHELHRHGATEASVVEELERWRDRFEISVYTMRSRQVDLQGIRVRRIPYLPGPLLPRFLWWLVANRVARRLDELKFGAPDVLYAPAVFCLDASAVSVHVVFQKWLRQIGEGTGLNKALSPGFAKTLHRSLYRALAVTLERDLYAGPAVLCALSKNDARELERVGGRPPGTVRVTPYGVDTERFSPANRMCRRAATRDRLGVAGRAVVLLIGNDARTKGADVAIAALDRLAEGTVLALAGHPDVRPLSAWTRTVGVADRVLFWPHTDDVLDYFAAADLVVAPSRSDAFNQPALEALACGLPLIVSARAGVTELLTDGETALILKNPEDHRRLADLIRSVLEDASLRKRLGDAGRHLAKQRTWARRADEVAAMIEEEAHTPHLLVILGDPREHTGLLDQLANLYGAGRVGVLQYGASTAKLSTARLLYRGSGLSYLLAAVRQARRRRNRHLIVIAADVRLAPYARVAAASARRPLAIWWPADGAMVPLRRAVRRAVRAADVVLAAGPASARQLEQLAGLPMGTVSVFPDGLPEGTLAGRRLGTMGRPRRAKAAE